MRQTLKTLREVALTAGIALTVFLGVQAWQTRDTPARWQADGTLAWVSCPPFFVFQEPMVSIET